MRTFSALFLLLTTTALSQTLDPQEPDRAKYEQFQSVLRQLGDPEPNLFCKDDVPKISGACQFKDICGFVRDRSDQEYYYRNTATGKGFPNIALIKLPTELRACLEIQEYQRVHSSTSLASPQSGQMFENEMTRKMNDLTKKTKEAKEKLEQERIRFYQSLKKSSDLKVIGAYERARNISGFSGPPNNTITKPEVTLTRLEEETGKKFSTEVRKNYLNYLESQARLQEASMAQVMSFGPVGDSRSPQTDSLKDQLFRNLQNEKFDVFFEPKLLKNEKKQFSAEYLDALKQNLSSEYERGFTIFQNTKKEVLRVIEGRRNQSNASEIENLKNRIESVTFKIPKTDHSGCSSPNAFYDASANSISLCPSFLTFPDLAIQDTLAHELGHSIDPCAVSYDLIENSPKNALSPGFIPDEGDPLETLKGSWRDENRKLLAFNFDDSQTQKVVMKAIDRKHYPFSSVVGCLKQKNSVEAVTADTRYLKQYEIEMKNVGLDKGDASHQRIAELKTHVKRMDETMRNECGSQVPSTGGYPQAQEAFSDWIAGEVIGNLLSREKDKKKKAIDAFESLGFFISAGCGMTKKENQKKIQELWTKLGCSQYSLKKTDELGNVHHEVKDSHPMMSKRINKIMLANPEIKSALGCSKDPELKKVVHCK